MNYKNSSCIACGTKNAQPKPSLVQESEDSYRIICSSCGTDVGYLVYFTNKRPDIATRVGRRIDNVGRKVTMPTPSQSNFGTMELWYFGNDSSHNEVFMHGKPLFGGMDEPASSYRKKVLSTCSIYG